MRPAGVKEPCGARSLDLRARVRLVRCSHYASASDLLCSMADLSARASRHSAKGTDQPPVRRCASRADRRRGPGPRDCGDPGEPVPHSGKTYRLFGPVEMDEHGVAKAVGEALGREVIYK